MNPALHKFLRSLIPNRYKPITMFPYPYRGVPLPVISGVSPDGLPYAEYQGIRVFFPKCYTAENAEYMYRGYLEDEGLTGLGRRTKSPHCYVTPLHHPKPNDILLDVGCAEGFFARWYVKDVKQVYLFESDSKWNDALNATFQGFKNKCVYVNKLVGDKTEGDCIRLADAIPVTDNDTFFLKMDIEGAERIVIDASAPFLQSHRVKMSCCVYHRPDDYRYLSKRLKDLGFTISVSNGRMCPYGLDRFPYFRRGVIYAQNF